MEDQKTGPGGVGLPPDPVPARISGPFVTVLAVLFTIALTFATLELPRWLTNVMNPWIDIPDYHPMNPEPIAEFMATSLVRPIGYASLVLVLVLVLMGLVTSRTHLSSAGAVLLFLPTFGYFAGYMFFLAGLGVLRALWLPLWSEWMALGDIAYLPYVLVVWPFWQVGLDVRFLVATTAIAAGILVFTASVVAWFGARASGRRMASGWPYRLSRHPQYLGWILWSWGFMVFASLQPTVRGGQNPGAGFPWVVSALIIVAVAWREEARMRRLHGSAYVDYQERTPFLAPVPQRVTGLWTSLVRRLLGRARPDTAMEALLTVAVCLVVAVLCSLPFVLNQWPPGGWWAWPL